MTIFLQAYAAPTPVSCHYNIIQRITSDFNIFSEEYLNPEPTANHPICSSAAERVAAALQKGVVLPIQFDKMALTETVGNRSRTRHHQRYVVRFVDAVEVGKVQLRTSTIQGFWVNPYTFLAIHRLIDGFRCTKLDIDREE